MSINIQDCPCSGKNMSNLTAPWILLTLSNHGGTHGYEIKKIISKYLKDIEIGMNLAGLYRQLNMLEKRGMLSSHWDTPDKGPAKRKYYLTEAGKECLWSWIGTLGAQMALIERFFDQAKITFPSASLPKVENHASRGAE